MAYEDGQASTVEGLQFDWFAGLAGASPNGTAVLAGTGGIATGVKRYSDSPQRPPNDAQFIPSILWIVAPSTPLPGGATTACELQVEQRMYPMRRSARLLLTVALAPLLPAKAAFATGASEATVGGARCLPHQRSSAVDRLATPKANTTRPTLPNWSAASTSRR